MLPQCYGLDLSTLVYDEAYGPLEVAIALLPANQIH